MNNAAEALVEGAQIENGSKALRVAWLGSAPSALESDEARAEIEDVALEAAAGRGVSWTGAPPDVVHVTAERIDALERPERALDGAAVVLDATGDAGALAGSGARAAARADLVLVGTLDELRRTREAQPALADRTALLRAPLDLDEHAPVELLRKRRDAEIKRFKRYHRLNGPVLLFAGPYTREGGLDTALDIVFGLRERLPELRLAAVPEGPTDSRYLDRCERKALALGHHGIVEWAPGERDLPLWYALADVVCSPGGSAAAAVRAAAAARPFVGVRCEALAEVVRDGETGFLVDRGGVDGLAAAVEALLGDGEEATRVGAAARQAVVEERAPAVWARELRNVWIDVLERHRARREPTRARG